MPRQPLADQRVAQRSPVALHKPQLAPIFVDVALDPRQRERHGIEQRLHPQRRAVARACLGLAARRVGFGGVDIGDADLGAVHPEGVAVDHAVDPLGPATDREARRYRLPRPHRAGPSSSPGPRPGPRPGPDDQPARRARRRSRRGRGRAAQTRGRRRDVGGGIAQPPPAARHVELPRGPGHAEPGRPFDLQPRRDERRPVDLAQGRHHQPDQHAVEHQAEL